MKSYKARGVFWSIGGFLGLFKPIRDTVSVPKKVNDDVSCNDICKFEFNAIKNHYSDIHNDILDRHQKNPQKGVFFSPEPLGGTRTRVFSGSTVIMLCS